MITLIVALLAALDGTAPQPNPWVEPARDVLVQACGSCHRPNLPTSNPRALAVFNLHDPVWYGTMTDEQLKEMRKRILGASKVDDADRNSVISFISCKLDGACDPPPAKESP